MKPSPILVAILAAVSLALRCGAVPTITKQPSPSTNSVSVGASLSSRISAATTNPPLRFEWQLEGVPLTNGTNEALLLTNIQTTNAGKYVAVISDGDGSVSSHPWTVEVDPAFTKITGDPCVESIGRASGVAWGDYNNDGFPDLFVTLVSAPNVLFTNTGNGKFARATGLPIVSGSVSAGAAWGDYDNDGRLDIFVSVNNGSDLLFHNNANSPLTRITAGSIVKDGGRGNGCAWGDYDNDGFLDLYVCNSDQNDFLYHNNGNGTFTKITTGPPVTATGNSQGCAWGDYDNDGRLDLYVTHYQSKNRLYHNNGDGTFTTVSNQPPVLDSSPGPSVWGDYDNDGYLDLFVGGQSGTNLLYHNDGNGTFTKIITGPIATDTGITIGAAWADYDNDGYLDLFVSQAGHPSLFYHNNGDASFSRIISGSLVADGGVGAGCAWGDYDNDGFPDLFVSGNNADYLYHNNGNTNNWITVQCLGRLSNRAAIGAKVRVKAVIGGKSTWQLREISGGGATGSQNDLRCQFGLSDAASVEIIRVEWPSGYIQEFTNVTARQILILKEPSKLTTTRVQTQSGELQVTLTGGKGLVYGLEKSTDLVQWIPLGHVTNQTGIVAWTNIISSSPLTTFFRASE